MSLRLPRPGTVPALALAVGLALTGCGANFEAQTYQERTTADGTNGAVGAIAVRNLSIVPPEQGDVHQQGDDVDLTLTLTNDGPEDDRLVEATTPAADEVELLVDGTPRQAVELPRLGTTGGSVSLRLVGLAEDLRPGQYVEVTLRFERNGEVTLSAPVATTGEYDEDREHSDNFHPIGEEHAEEGEQAEQEGGETSGSSEGLPGAGQESSGG